MGEEYSEKEVERAFKELKGGKAAGRDGLKAEMWKEIGKRGKEKFKELMNQLWRGHVSIPAPWRVGRMSPIHKEGDEGKAENYRGITIMGVGYKIAMSLVRNRLEEEVEEKGLLPESQGGFRRGRGTRDQIVTLARMTERVREKKGSMFAVFLDLKAAYDTIPRESMIECLRRRGVSEGMVEWVRDVYEETWIEAKVGEEVSEKFKTWRGLRQGCPLGQVLFNLYISALDEMLRKGQERGVVIGKCKVWMLAYADDMVLMGKDWLGMKGILKKVKRYMDKRGLCLNVGKTKWMRFRNKGREGTVRELEWKGKVIEKVKRFRYLGFIFKETGGYEEHLRYVQGKARKAWGKWEGRMRNNVKVACKV